MAGRPTTKFLRSTISARKGEFSFFPLQHTTTTAELADLIPQESLTLRIRLVRLPTQTLAPASRRTSAFFSSDLRRKNLYRRADKITFLPRIHKSGQRHLLLLHSILYDTPGPSGAEETPTLGTTTPVSIEIPQIQWRTYGSLCECKVCLSSSIQPNQAKSLQSLGKRQRLTRHYRIDTMAGLPPCTHAPHSHRHYPAM